MGCRPSKHATSKIRDAHARAGSQCTCLYSPRKYNKKHKCNNSNGTTGSRRTSSGTQSGSHGHQSHSSTGNRSRSHKSDDTEFPVFSTTTAVYRRSASKASKITLRLSSDGSTLEIEQCEYDIVKSKPQPQVITVTRQWNSAPNLTTRSMSSVSPLFRNIELHMRPSTSAWANAFVGRTTPDTSEQWAGARRPLEFGDCQRQSRVLDGEAASQIHSGRFDFRPSDKILSNADRLIRNIKRDQSDEQVPTVTKYRKSFSVCSRGSSKTNRFSHPLYHRVDVLNEGNPHPTNRHSLQHPSFDSSNLPKNPNLDLYGFSIPGQRCSGTSQQALKTTQHQDRCTASLRSFSPSGGCRNKNYSECYEANKSNKSEQTWTDKESNNSKRTSDNSSHLKKLNQRASIPRYDCFSIRDYHNIYSQSSSCLADISSSQGAGGIHRRDRLRLSGLQKRSPSHHLRPNQGHLSSNEKLTDREKLILNLSSCPPSFDNTIVSKDVGFTSLVGRRDENWHSNDNLISARPQDQPSTLRSFLKSPPESNAIRTFVELGCPLPPPSKNGTNPDTDPHLMFYSPVRGSSCFTHFDVPFGKKSGDQGLLSSELRKRELSKTSLHIYENVRGEHFSKHLLGKDDRSFDQANADCSTDIQSNPCNHSTFYAGFDQRCLQGIKDKKVRKTEMVNDKPIDTQYKTNWKNIAMEFNPPLESEARTSLIPVSPCQFILKSEVPSSQPPFQTETSKLASVKRIEKLKARQYFDNHSIEWGGKASSRQRESNSQDNSIDSGEKRNTDVQFGQSREDVVIGGRNDLNVGAKDGEKDEVIANEGKEKTKALLRNHKHYPDIDQNSLTKEELTLNAAIQYAFNMANVSISSRTQSLPLLCYNNSFGECFPWSSQAHFRNYQNDEKRLTPNTRAAGITSGSLDSTNGKTERTDKLFYDHGYKINTTYPSRRLPGKRSDGVSPLLIESTHVFHSALEQKEKIDNGVDSRKSFVDPEFRNVALGHSINNDGSCYSDSLDDDREMFLKVGVRSQEDNEEKIVVPDGPRSLCDPITDNEESAGHIGSISPRRKVDTNWRHNEMSRDDEKSNSVDKLAKGITMKAAEPKPLRAPGSVTVSPDIRSPVPIRVLKAHIISRNISDCAEDCSNFGFDKINIVPNRTRSFSGIPAISKKDDNSLYEVLERRPTCDNEELRSINLDLFTRNRSGLEMTSKSALHAKYALTHARTAKGVNNSLSHSNISKSPPHIITPNNWPPTCTSVGDSRSTFIKFQRTLSSPSSTYFDANDEIPSVTSNVENSCWNSNGASVLPSQIVSAAQSTHITFPPTIAPQMDGHAIVASATSPSPNFSSAPHTSAALEESSSKEPLSSPTSKSQLLSSYSSDSLSCSVSSNSLSNTLHSNTPPQSDTHLSDSFTSDTSHSDTPQLFAPPQAEILETYHMHPNATSPDYLTSLTGTDEPLFTQNRDNRDNQGSDASQQNAFQQHVALASSFSSSQSNSPPSSPHSTLSPSSSSLSQSTLSPYTSPPSSPLTPKTDSDKNVLPDITYSVLNSETFQSCTNPSNPSTSSTSQNPPTFSSSPSPSPPPLPPPPPILSPPPLDPYPIMESGLSIRAPSTSCPGIPAENSKSHQKQRIIDLEDKASLNLDEIQNSPWSSDGDCSAYRYVKEDGNISGESGQKLQALIFSRQNGHARENRSALSDEENSVEGSKCCEDEIECGGEIINEDGECTAGEIHEMRVHQTNYDESIKRKDNHDLSNDSYQYHYHFKEEKLEDREEDNNENYLSYSENCIRDQALGISTFPSSALCLADSDHESFQSLSDEQSPESRNRSLNGSDLASVPCDNLRVHGSETFICKDGEVYVEDLAGTFTEVGHHTPLLTHSPGGGGEADLKHISLPLTLSSTAECANVLPVLPGAFQSTGDCEEDMTINISKSYNEEMESSSRKIEETNRLCFDRDLKEGFKEINNGINFDQDKRRLLREPCSADEAINKGQDHNYCAAENDDVMEQFGIDGEINMTYKNQEEYSNGILNQRTDYRPCDELSTKTMSPEITIPDAHEGITSHHIKYEQMNPGIDSGEYYYGKPILDNTISDGDERVTFDSDCDISANIGRVLISPNQTPHVQSEESRATNLHTTSANTFSNGRDRNDYDDLPFTSPDTTFVNVEQRSWRRTENPKRNVQLLVKHFEAVSVSLTPPSESLAQEKMAAVGQALRYRASDS